MQDPWVILGANCTVDFPRSSMMWIVIHLWLILQLWIIQDHNNIMVKKNCMKMLSKKCHLTFVLGSLCSLNCHREKLTKIRGYMYNSVKSDAHNYLE